MNVTALTLAELEQMLEEYPWFTLARKEYVRRQGAMGEDALRRAAAEAGIFLLSRSEFLDELHGRVRKKSDATKAQTEVKTVQPESASTTQAPHFEQKNEEGAEKKPRYYVVNGDYFDKEDYKELEETGQAFDTSALAFNPIASALGTIESAAEQKAQASAEAEKAQEDGLCTETLARIYMEQEVYQRAIDIYEKLILLYPQKSAYFASLIEKAKNIK